MCNDLIHASVSAAAAALTGRFKPRYNVCHGAELGDASVLRDCHRRSLRLVLALQARGLRPSGDHPSQVGIHRGDGCGACDLAYCNVDPQVLRSVYEIPDLLGVRGSTDPGIQPNQQWIPPSDPLHGESMNESKNASPDALAQSQLARMKWFHRVNYVLFWASLVGVFGGLASFAFSQSVGSAFMATGFVLWGLLLLECYVIYPRLICPRCKHRFFLPDGAWHWLSRINPARERCLHCGLSLHASR